MDRLSHPQKKRLEESDQDKDVDDKKGTQLRSTIQA